MLIATWAILPVASDTPGQIGWLGEGLGARNKEILEGLPGLSGAEIDELRLAGVI